MGMEVPQNGFEKKALVALKIFKPEALKNRFVETHFSCGFYSSNGLMT